MNVLERTTGPKAELFPFDPKETKKATSYLAKIIWDSIGEVVVSARQAMDYLQKVSRVAAKANRPCSWQAPSGFPILQRYSKIECAPITTRTVRRGKVKIFIAKDTDALDAKRQEQGISPNFVHSLDAAALVFTVVSAGLQGIRSFAMIHDSYATHACDTDVLAQCCRIAFVECVYSRDVLADFTEQVRQMLPDEAELPPMPPQGSLDLALVLDSPFFFA
jgi:DNA-directed RNA polymerase